MCLVSTCKLSTIFPEVSLNGRNAGAATGLEKKTHSFQHVFLSKCGKDLHQKEVKGFLSCKITSRARLSVSLQKTQRSPLLFPVNYSTNVVTFSTNLTIV